MSQYLIASIGHTGRHNEHICLWKPDSRGYTICIDKAGRYSEDEARRICLYGASIAIRVELVEPLARSTPYYRMTNGSLARMYDGGPHRPVPNDTKAWRHLRANRLVCSLTTEKPTPMPSSKARAIYLDGLAQGGEP